jgi:hypothetical protein
LLLTMLLFCLLTLVLLPLLLWLTLLGLLSLLLRLTLALWLGLLLASLLSGPFRLLLFLPLSLVVLFPVCRLVFTFGSLARFSGVYGLLVKDLIYEILFLEEFYPLNFELLGNLPQFGNQHLAQFKNIMHVVKCVEELISIVFDEAGI